MKLKEALKVAKEMGYHKIAVDEDRRIYAYENGTDVEPCLEYRLWKVLGEPLSYALTRPIEVGWYEGNKNWKDTLRGNQ